MLSRGLDRSRIALPGLRVAALAALFALDLVLLGAAGGTAAAAPNCKKGQPCGNSCIFWDKVCRKPSPGHAPDRSLPAQRPGDIPATVSCSRGTRLVPGSSPPVCR
jgi:hypothetical protein